jgi:hypothetical protein
MRLSAWLVVPLFIGVASVDASCGGDGAPAGGGSDDAGGGSDGAGGVDVTIESGEAGADVGSPPDAVRGDAGDEGNVPLDSASDAWLGFDAAACNCIDAAPKCCGPTLCVSDQSPMYGCAQTGCDPCPTYANATAVCMSGACAPSCAPGWGDCDMIASNGCETATVNNVAACGGCGQACAPLPNAKVGCSVTTCGIASCNTGWGDCDQNAANGCETDLTQTAAHCGSCTTACAAGLVCAASSCGGVNQTTLVTLATGLDFGATTLGNFIAACQLAVDDALYFATKTTIYKVPKTGGTPVALAAGGVYGIAVDATYVYFGDGTTIQRVPKSGGTATTVVTAATSYCIAVDATSVYWTAPNSAWKADKTASGAGTRLATVNAVGNYGLAVDGTNVYWGSGGSGTGTLYSVPLGGGTPNPLATAFSFLQGVTLDATNVYYASFSGAFVYAKAGGAPALLDAAGNTGIAVDALDVFWAASNGSIARRPIAGGANVVLVNGLNNPNSVAVDATSVYFTDVGNGPTSTLYSVAK